MKNVDKSLMCMCIICAAVWLVVFLMIGYLYLNLTKQKVTTQTPVEKEYEEPKKVVITSMLDKSISICKGEQATDIAHAVNTASKKYDIPHYVIYAIIATESGKHRTEDITPSNVMMVNHKASSSCNCKGLMQVSCYAVEDYNKINLTEYTLDDMYDIYINIEVGTWHFSQFRNVATSWTEMYIIYNVGYGRYNKINNYWFYDWNGCWHSGYRNSFFFMNSLYPPEDSNRGLCGKNALPKYNAKERFEKCLDLCYQHFYN